MTGTWFVAFRWISIIASLLPAVSVLGWPPPAPSADLEVAQLSLLGARGPKAARGTDIFVIGWVEKSTDFGSVNLYRVDTESTSVEPLLSAEQARNFTGGLLLMGNIAADPVRDRFAIVSPPVKAPGHDSRLTMVDLETSTVEVLVDNGMYNFLPVFSPDGNKLAYFAVPTQSIIEEHTHKGPLAGYALWVLDLPTKTQRMMSQPALFVRTNCPPAWSPDGTQLAFVAQYGLGRRPIHLVHADGSSSKTIALQVKNQYIDSVVWPKQDFLMATFSASEQVTRINVKDESLQVVVEKGLQGCLSLSPDGRYIAARTFDDPEGRRVRVIDLKGNLIEPGAPGSPTTPLAGTVWSLPPVKHE